MSYVKSLGWFIRFVAPVDREPVAAFYRDVIGLPFVRAGSAQPVDFLWAGEALIHELIFEGRMAAPDPLDADPATAPLTPIYRTPDLDGLLDRLSAAGAALTPVETAGFGRQAFARDPAGGLIGFRQPGDLTSPVEREAQRRRLRGEAFNPGCASLPPDISELGWLVRRVQNVAAQSAFFGTSLGLPALGEVDGRALFDLGDNVVLELAPGGRVAAAPENRAERSATFILRIRDIAAFQDKMRSLKAPIVHDLIRWDRGVLSYISDPEGVLVGVEEKHHPSRYAPAQPPFPEDLEAQRRWVERQGNGRSSV